MSDRVASSSLTRLTVQDLASRRDAIAAAQEQISSGRRINRPSDDPAAAARLVGIDASLARLSQFERNAGSAESSLALQETVLASVVDSVQRIRELTVQANNGTNGAGERDAIAAEINTRLDGLYDLANTRNSNGDALFAGSRATVTPFTPGSPTSYDGDDTPRRVAIGLDREVIAAEPGSDVFMRLKDGNGRFRVAADPGNTGTGTLQPGAVTDESAFTGARFRINFTAPDRYDVTDADTGTVLQSGVAFEPGGAIELGGMSSAIDGAPASGDAFLLEPAEQRDLFTAVSQLVDTLGMPGDDAGARTLRHQSMNSTLASLDLALDHLGEHRARAGARLQSIDASRSENAAVTLQLEATSASLEDADMVDVITRLERESQSLELLQKSYARFASISILDYL